MGKQRYYNSSVHPGDANRDLSRVKIICNRSARSIRDLVIKSFAQNLSTRQGGWYTKRNMPDSQNVKAKIFPDGAAYVRLLCDAREQTHHMIFAFHSPDLYETKKAIVKSNMPRHVKYRLIKDIVHTTETDFRESMKLLDAASQSGSDRIYVYATAFPDARQDKKDESKVSISARLNLDQIVNAAGTPLKRIGAVDLHAKQIQGMVKKPLDEMLCAPVFFMHMRYTLTSLDDVVLILVDTGSFKKYADSIEQYGLQYGFIPKGARIVHGQVKGGKYQGPPLKDKNVVLIDDMVDTGGTIRVGAQLGVTNNAKGVYIYTTHGYFSTKLKKDRKSKRVTGVQFAEDKFRGSGIKVICSDSIPRTDLYRKLHKDWLVQFSVAPLIGDLIYFNENGMSHGEEIKRMEDIAMYGKRRDLQKELSRFFIYN